MADESMNPIGITRAGTRLGYKFLQEDQIAMIDEALASLGEFGEVRLVVEKGRLRFLIKQESFDALKWHPGGLQSASR